MSEITISEAGLEREIENCKSTLREVFQYADNLQKGNADEFSIKIRLKALEESYEDYKKFNRLFSLNYPRSPFLPDSWISSPFNEKYYDCYVKLNKHLREFEIENSPKTSEDQKLSDELKKMSLKQTKILEKLENLELLNAENTKNISSELEKLLNTKLRSDFNQFVRELERVKVSNNLVIRKLSEDLKALGTEITKTIVGELEKLATPNLHQ